MADEHEELRKHKEELSKVVDSLRQELEAMQDSTEELQALKHDAVKLGVGKMNLPMSKRDGSESIRSMDSVDWQMFNGGGPVSEMNKLESEESMPEVAHSLRCFAGQVPQPRLDGAPSSSLGPRSGPQVEVQVQEATNDGRPLQHTATKETGTRRPGGRGTSPLMAMASAARSSKASVQVALTSLADHRLAHNAIVQKELAADGQEQERKWRCVLDPVGRFRLAWDISCFWLLMYELWSVPVLEIFLAGMPQPTGMVCTSDALTLFFACDIVLNFFTGYFHQGFKVMTNRQIVKNYIRFWLWLDLLATIPWDLILTITNSNDGAALFRLAKASKARRTLRCLKLLRAIRLISQMKKANAVSQHVRIPKLQRVISRVVQGSILVSVLSHLNGCVWGALQQDWIQEMHVNTVGAGLHLYYESFHWAFCGLVLGQAKPSKVVGPEIWTFEMIVASQRVALIVASFILLYKWFGYVPDKGSSKQIKEDALRYMRRHKVGIDTQIHVLFNLHETSQARNQQRRFEQLMSNDLPSELRQTVCNELWSDKLTHLGLLACIQDWSRDFIPQLALMCREEVHATKAIIFRQGERSTAAYYIISGTVRVLSESSPADYEDNQWVGERALINPRFRRSATVLTKALTSLMVVPAKETHDLIESLNLTTKFQALCHTELCYGLCGRCGVVGDHFSEDCPGPVLGQSDSAQSVATAKLARSITASWTLARSRGAAHAAARKPHCSRRLVRYLEAHDLQHLRKILEGMHVTDLHGLMEMDLAKLHDHMTEPFSKQQQCALEPDFINEYINKEVQRRTSAKVSVLSEVETCHQHFGFLSHYKIEAGTEAALMRTEMDQLVKEDEESAAHFFDTPFFLDSENLSDLKDLQRRVHNSHNLIVFLSKGVFTRPWCLVEIVTAVRARVALLPVHLNKPGVEFEYPDEQFYADLLQGKLLDESANQVLRTCGVTIDEVEAAIRELLCKISLPFSPHKSARTRRAELQAILMKLNCEGIQT